MSGNATLVVELFTEELPPKALKFLGQAFADGVQAGLTDRGYLTSASVMTPYATPRRLAVSTTHVLATSPDAPVTQKLMPASVALDDSGKPTVALQRKLAAIGRPHLADKWPNAVDGSDRLTLESDGKADALYLHSIARGSPLQPGLQATLDDTLARLPIPKVMSYAGGNGYYNDVKFVRPAHRLLALHGADVVAVTALALAADRLTGGHRFLSRDGIAVASANAYEETLRAEGKVIAGFAERRAAIVAALTRAATGATVMMPDALLDEVTGLVEWPAVYEGAFDPAFLAVPQECLILTMQQNQKYFALAGGDGRLVPRFLVVSNIETTEPGPIIQGNERVLRARLADARFFFDQDRKTRLDARVGHLTQITYHNQLGTVFERVVRLKGIAGELAALMRVDTGAAERAALLAKADLVTDMVGEFPELQGTMGRYYALYDGEQDAIAAAVEQHYWPRHAGDELPREGVAQVVALADKLETLAGLFGIGQEPTGDRDPFGLRRAALGVLRILIEKRLHLGLSECVSTALRWHESEVPRKAWADETAAQARPLTGVGKGGDTMRASADTPRRFPPETRGLVLDFAYDRLRGYLRERGYAVNAIAAVVDERPEFLDDLPARLDAVTAFEALPEAAALASANKRIINILRKSGNEAGIAVDRGRLTDGAEHDLYLAFQKLEPIVDERCAAGDFTGALLALAATRPAVDRFFDDVLVMADDRAVRANRLALLRGVAQTMNRVADISKLAA